MVEPNDASCTYTDVSVQLPEADCCCSEEEKGELKEVEKEEVVVEMGTAESTDVDISVNDVRQYFFLADMI